MLLVQSAFSNSLHPLHPLGKYLMLETFVNVSAWLNRIDYWGVGGASWVKHTEIQQTALGLWHIKNFSHHSLWGSLVPWVYYISWKYESLWTIEKHFWRKNRNVNIYGYITKSNVWHHCNKPSATAMYHSGYFNDLSKNLIDCFLLAEHWPQLIY